MYAAVDDRQKLVVSARIAEELGVDGERASAPPAARSTQRVLHVEVAVAGERHATAARSRRLVAAIPRPVEHEHLPAVRILADAAAAAAAARQGVARQIEDGVETGVAAMWRWRRYRLVHSNTTCRKQTAHRASDVHACEYAKYKWRHTQINNETIGLLFFIIANRTMNKTETYNKD